MPGPLENTNKDKTLVKIKSYLGENKDGLVVIIVLQDVFHTISLVDDKEVAKLVTNSSEYDKF
jgi:hypothetical protein